MEEMCLSRDHFPSSRRNEVSDNFNHSLQDSLLVLPLMSVLGCQTTALLRRQMHNEASLSYSSSSSSTQSKYYVSITGLQLKSIFYEPIFWYHAIPSMIQARSSPGNISADSFTNNAIKHAVSVWTDKASMLQYLRQGAHVQAMKINNTISNYGKVYGYYTDHIPTDCNEIVELWEKNGRIISGGRTKANPE